VRILAIETSCDETAIALLEAAGGLHAPRFRIIKNLVSSQISVHAPFGGVVPGLAKREHLKNLPILFKKLTTKSSKLTPDLIAVTVGPGLEPALWTGITFAKEIFGGLKVQNPDIKLIGVNHLEGHLYSFLLTNRDQSKAKSLFPAIALVVSGGHTMLLKMDSLVRWRLLGETRDDAVGEAFDKVARILALPYPGGPKLEQLARRGNRDAIPFPRPMIHDRSPAGEYDFSFSGLKTSVLYHLRDSASRRTDFSRADVAASFQASAIDVLAAKTLRAVEEYRAKSVFLSGGVAANGALRKQFSIASRKLSVNFLVAPKKFNTDNATMIGVAAYLTLLRGKRFPLRANGILSLTA